MSSIISQANYISGAAEMARMPLESNFHSESFQAGRGTYHLLDYIEGRRDGDEKKLMHILSNFENRIDNPFRLQVAMSQHAELFDALSSVVGELKRAINKVEQING